MDKNVSGTEFLSALDFLATEEYVIGVFGSGIEARRSRQGELNPEVIA